MERFRNLIDAVWMMQDMHDVVGSFEVLFNVWTVVINFERDNPYNREVRLSLYVDYEEDIEGISCTIVNHDQSEMWEAFASTAHVKYDTSMYALNLLQLAYDYLPQRRII